MDSRLKALIDSDLDRCFGKGVRPRFYRLLNPSVRCTIAYRKAAFYTRQGGGPRALWARIRYLRLCQKYLFSIPYTASIGPGLVIGHTGSVIVNEAAVLGRNISLSTGIVIGAAAGGKKPGAPRLCDRVWVGSNAVIVGGVTVGEDVLIAPGAFVNFDVPPHSVVVGNPGVVHAKANATAAYLQHCD